MKKLLFTLAISLCSLLFAPCSTMAQTIPPPFINYQAVLYDVNGANPNSPLINQSFTTFVNINDELGNLLYREEHYASTDANGLITVKMGDGLYTAGPITNFNQIDWGVGKYYLVVDFDINGTISSTAPEQLVTVPYSFYAGKAGNGMTAVADNGNGTLTFTYANGSTYTTPTLAGIQGPVGPSGASGPSGPQGVEGQSAYDLWLAQGNTGTVQDFLSTSAYQIWLAQGNTGTAQDFLNTLVGPSGPQGIQGTQGIPGTNGTNGATGPQGPQGIQGVAGPSGASGTAGPAGAQGLTGPNGKSAYEIAVLNGFVGTETQWLLSLVGAAGPAGATGPQGIQGPTGNDGATGPQGPIGLTGATGPQGIQGLAGNDGATGAQGPIGLTGATGATGPQGPIGLTGPQGPQGIQGPAGANGTSGLNALIKTTTEPAGANCTNGGTKIETGLDANNDGILDIGEVNTGQTKYVCDGFGGSGGMPFSNIQVYSTPGTYSWICPAGTTKIMVECWGAGGGGSFMSVYPNTFAGGGGGGYAKSVLAVAPGMQYNVVVGAGGIAVNTGANFGVGLNGGNSSFNGMVVGNGGGGGNDTSWGMGHNVRATGGSGSGEVVRAGGNYIVIHDSSNGMTAYIYGYAPNSSIGSPPAFPGGGAANGGNGANGQVIITY